MSTLLLLLWIFSAAAQMLLFFFGRSADLASLHPASRLTAAEDPTPQPRVALMIPVAGHTPEMEVALHSLLQQEYSALTVFLATHSEDDLARKMARELIRQYPQARHVDSGPATHCGQKNQNLLACLQVVEPDTALYIFCDANHQARPDFVLQLVRPILQGQARLCTGYRRSRLCGTSPAAVAYHALNRFMGLLEALPIFTQPWGGALAVDALTFHELDIKGLWSRTVVDDSSLAGLLMKKGIRMSYCPGALLDSPVTMISNSRLNAWFFRQLFYPKFYTYISWLQIGAALLWFAAVCLTSFALPLAWLSGCPVPGAAAAAAVLHLLSLLLFQELLRRRIAPSCPRAPWFRGLLLAVWTTYYNFCRTILARKLLWHGIEYKLAGDGRVLRVRREKGA